MVSLTIMATMTGTHMAPAHFHTTKLQMTWPVRVLRDIIWFLRAQWRVGNGWKEVGWAGALEPSFTVSLNITNIKRLGL